MDTKNGRALVTGGAQGIGRAICEALLSKGCKVCCADINVEKSNRTVEDLQKSYGKENCIFVKCDVSLPNNFEEAYLKAKQSFGHLNILINNAGVCDDDRNVDINLKGVINGCNIAYKYMGNHNGGEGGVVVNIASVAALKSFPHMPTYAASKAGVIALTRGYGHELHCEKTGIKFNAVCPGPVSTDLLFSGISKMEFQEILKESLSKRSIAEPSKVGEAIIQLLEGGDNGVIIAVIEGKENTYITFTEEEQLH